MALKFHAELSKSLLLLLNNVNNEYDVIIRVEGNREFRAHSNILKARSNYFEIALSDRWCVRNNNIIEFQKPNIDPTVFEMVLRYIYAGEVDLTRECGAKILGLLVASDELSLDELFIKVQDYLIENRNSWIQQNFVLVLHTVFYLSNCKKLQDHCIESICADPEPFFTSDDFLLLDNDILFGLLRRDDLQIEEIVAWENLIKWGIVRTPGLGSSNSNNRNNWNNDNFKALKETLSQFIPLIRFVSISSDDFFVKVRPYKAILPHYIYEEVMEFYMRDAVPRTTILPPRVRRRAGFERRTLESQIAVPQSTESQTTVPQSTESQTTVPQRTESQPTLPQRTELRTTVPQRTESQTTVPQRTELRTTVPQRTESQTTVPQRTAESPRAIRSRQQNRRRPY